MMKTSMYVAASLDGFIARPDGDISWLESIEGAAEDYGYQDFYETVDCLVMGGKTFRQMCAFSKWPYTGKATWVYSRSPVLTDIPGVFHVGMPPKILVKQLKDEGKQHLWVLGGGEIHSLFLRAGFIDEIRLFIMPLALGEGIPLFAPPLQGRRWRLADLRRWNGDMAELRYVRPDDGEPVRQQS